MGQSFFALDADVDTPLAAGAKQTDVMKERPLPSTSVEWRHHSSADLRSNLPALRPRMKICLNNEIDESISARVHEAFSQNRLICLEGLVLAWNTYETPW